MELAMEDVESHDKKPKKGHPPGLYLLFTVEMWERFGYYGMRAILTLYMTAAIIMPEGQAAVSGLGFSEADAGMIMGYFQGFVYLMPILGGFLADRYLGRRISITIGGLLMAAGYGTLAFTGNITTFFAGLAFICIGNGFFKPNISTVVGSLYAPGDARRDTAFTIFYMGINIGALIAPVVAGFFRTEDSGYMGYSYGFGAAAVGMMLGLVAYWLLGDRFLGDLGKKPDSRKRDDLLDFNLQGTPGGAEEKKKEHDRETLLLAERTGISVSKIERDRIIVIFVLAFFVIAFWAGFDLAPTAITFFTEKHINKDTGLFLFDTTYFQSLNPLLVVVLAPLFAVMWTVLSRYNREPNTPVKMGLGIILAGAGFLFMYGAASLIDSGSPNAPVLASFWWVAATYLFHTFGELCLSPVGLSMITKLAPARVSSLMMGIWFVSVFLANIIAGYMVALTEEMGYTEFFLALSVVIMGLGVILLAISGPLRKMMHGVG